MFYIHIYNYLLGTSRLKGFPLVGGLVSPCWTPHLPVAPLAVDSLPMETGETHAHSSVLGGWPRDIQVSREYDRL